MEIFPFSQVRCVSVKVPSKSSLISLLGIKLCSKGGRLEFDHLELFNYNTIDF